MEEPKAKPRISVEVSEELKDEITRFLRYREQKIVITTFATAFVHACHKFGKDVVIGGFLSDEYDWAQLVKLYKEDQDKLLELPDFSVEEPDGKHISTE